MPMREFRYVQYAERWNWPPDVVDRIPLDLDLWMLPIAGAIDEVKAKRQKPV